MKNDTLLFFIVFLLVSTLTIFPTDASERSLPEGQHTLQPWLQTKPESWKALGTLVTISNAVNAGITSYNQHQQEQYRKQQEAYTNYLNDQKRAADYYNQKYGRSRIKPGGSGQASFYETSNAQKQQHLKNIVNNMKSNIKYKPKYTNKDLFFIPISSIKRHRCIAC